MPSYPVVAELWSLLEGTLQSQAKRLVEDIAKHQKADPKELWSKVKGRIQIGLLDVDLPETLHTYCSHLSGTVDGAVRLRCRAPCVLGFDACPRHVGVPLKQETSTYEKVHRMYDHLGNVYFVDTNSIALDKNGKPRGYIEDGTLVLFEKTNGPDQ